MMTLSVFVYVLIGCTVCELSMGGSIFWLLAGISS